MKKFMIHKDVGYELVEQSDEDASACSDCAFETCSTASCQELPLSCGTARQYFVERDKTSDEFLLARLKGEL